MQEQQSQFDRMGPADDPVTQPEPKKKRKPGKGGGSALSTAMAEFLGVTELPRPQVVKAIWAYIKEHELQDPADKRKILLDDRLEKLFPGQSETTVGSKKARTNQKTDRTNRSEPTDCQKTDRTHPRTALGK